MIAMATIDKPVRSIDPLVGIIEGRRIAGNVGETKFRLDCKKYGVAIISNGRRSAVRQSELARMLDEIEAESAARAEARNERAAAFSKAGLLARSTPRQANPAAAKPTPAPAPVSAPACPPDAATVAALSDAMNVDADIARLLVAAGLTNARAVAEVDLSTIAAIPSFDLEFATEVQTWARESVGKAEPKTESTP